MRDLCPLWEVKKVLCWSTEQVSPYGRLGRCICQLQRPGFHSREVHLTGTESEGPFKKSFSSWEVKSVDFSGAQTEGPFKRVSACGGLKNAPFVNGVPSVFLLQYL